MTSSTDDVITVFFDKLEADDDFFNYYGVDEEEAFALAKERGMSYLREAMLDFRRKGNLEFTLALGNDGDFQEPITDDEIDILSEIMVLKHYRRKLAKLKPRTDLVGATDMRWLPSAANERSTYVTLIGEFENHIREMLSHYRGIDRDAGTYKIVDEPVPEDEE